MPVKHEDPGSSPGGSNKTCGAIAQLDRARVSSILVVAVCFSSRNSIRYRGHEFYVLFQGEVYFLCKLFEDKFLLISIRGTLEASSSKLKIFPEKVGWYACQRANIVRNGNGSSDQVEGRHKRVLCSG